jgi:hypothetical protein
MRPVPEQDSACRQGNELATGICIREALLEFELPSFPRLGQRDYARSAARQLLRVGVFVYAGSGWFQMLNRLGWDAVDWLR